MSVANISLCLYSTSLLQKCPSLFSSETFQEKFTENCHISVCSSCFSSFCISSVSFLALPFVSYVSLSNLVVFNISTSPSERSPSITASTQTTCLMSGCIFASVCDVYDGGVVSSLNNPSSSLSSLNASFVRCYRTQNVVYSGSEGYPSRPGRQNQTTNGVNSFTLCEWNGSKTIGIDGSYTDGISSGGAIFMYGLSSGVLSVKFCSFYNCYTHYCGGGIFCNSIYAVEIENTSFISCACGYY